MKNKLIFLILLFGLTFSETKQGYAQPKGVHLSWNTSEDNTLAHSMSFTWFDDHQFNGFVHFGKKAGKLDETLIAKAEYVQTLHTNAFKSTAIGLSPSTVYFYRVGSDSSGWSQVFKFTTAPLVGQRAKISIGILSDTQNNEGNVNFEETDSIVSQLSKRSVLFTIHNGDMVENGSMEKNWKGFFDAMQPLNAHYPLMVATGNHDVINDLAGNFQMPFPVFYQLFNLPLNQQNYSYSIGNAHFIAINSGVAQKAEKNNKVLFAKDSEEYHWLETDLIKARQDRRIHWIILYCHYPMYSYGVSLVQTWQKHLVPLIDKYKVDLVLSGHRHVYERHAAVTSNEIFKPADRITYRDSKGTVYITNGSAGGSLQGLGGKELPTMLFTPDQKLYTYALMTIDKDNVRYEVYDKNDRKIDVFEIIKP